MEQLSLTQSQVVPAVTTTFYRVMQLTLNWELRFISIVLRGENGERLGFSYEGDVAETLMIALNKMDLSVQSMHKRILNRLIADGKIGGTVTGSPD